MGRPDGQEINSVLVREVSEFTASRSFLTFLSMLVMLVVSMVLTSAVTTGTVWVIAAYLGNELSERTLVGIAIAAPILGLAVGYLAKDSLNSPGSRMAEDALARDTVSWGPGYGRDDQAAQAGFGCLLFLLQSMAGGIYASAAGLLCFLKPGHDKERELAVSIVGHLLEHGTTPVDDLVQSLAQQGVPRERVGSTLGLLRKAGVLEPSQERLSISPVKRHLFDGCL